MGVIRSATARALVLVVGASLCASGCSSGAPASSVPDSEASALSGPYAADVRAISEQSDDDFVVSVTEDGAITEAEFAETQDRYVRCMHDAGWPEYEVVDAPGGLWGYVTPDEGGDSGDAAARCARESGLGVLEPVYVETIVNPDREDPAELLARCLVAVDAVDPGYTGEQYAADLNAGVDVVASAGDPEAAEACLNNPASVLDEGRDP